MLCFPCIVAALFLLSWCGVDALLNMSESVALPRGGGIPAADGRPHRIVIALNFGTTAVIDHIRRTWLPAGSDVPSINKAAYVGGCRVV